MKCKVRDVDCDKVARAQDQEVLCNTCLLGQLVDLLTEAMNR